MTSTPSKPRWPKSTTALRYTLRLIHCIQRERGASCALAGAKVHFQPSRETNHEMTLSPVTLLECHPHHVCHIYTQKVRSARIATNSAMTFFYEGHVDCETHPRENIASNLFRIRQLVDQEYCNNTNRKENSSELDITYDKLQSDKMDDENIWLFHRVVKEFTSLLSNIIKIHVVEYILKHNDCEDARRNLSSIKKLLLSFVTLKESFGFERATLSGIMNITNNTVIHAEIPCSPENNALEKQDSFRERKDEDSTVPRLPIIVNDLVMVVENQHKILMDLQQQTGIQFKSGNPIRVPTNDIHEMDENYYCLLRLIGESLKQSDAMENLQAHIRKNFDVHSFQKAMTMEEFWTDITLYMDRLHSMELLLLEELDHHDEGLENLDLLGLDTREELYTVDQNTLIAASTLANEDLQQPDTTLKKESDCPELEEWEISLYDVEFHRRIGRGAAGTTYLGKWCGQLVAVKVASMSELGLDGWRTELSSLKRLHHPNIIRFLGAIYNPSPITYCLVLEYCDGGDLSKALLNDTPPGFVVKVISDIAKGLFYLHKRKIMHRDIKPSNCLLHGAVKSGCFTAKLTDFGLAAIVHAMPTSDGWGELTAETGTYRYMAPEVIRHEPYHYSADVYSFSLLIWELVCREKPFSNMGPIEAASAVALEGSRPPFPDGIPACLKSVIERCWMESPDERMSVLDIIEWIEDINDNLTSESKTWLDNPKGHPAYNTRAPEIVEKERQTAVCMNPFVHKENAKKVSKMKIGLFGRNKRNTKAV